MPVVARHVLAADDQTTRVMLISTDVESRTDKIIRLNLPGPAPTSVQGDTPRGGVVRVS
jgi:hypothetical protein